MAHHDTYSQEQLGQYFDRVCLPRSKRIYDVSSLSETDKVNFLELLSKHQLCKVPWENITQHYSWHRVVNVKAQHLFNKIVLNPGRGGYCMEVNYFFHVVLLSLRFDIRMAGSRIYRRSLGNYGGWTHLVNVVTIAGTKYLLDGGFSGNGPSAPVVMEHGLVRTQIAPAHMRVVHDCIPQYLDKSQKVWIFEHRYDESREWAPMYCYTEMEFTPEDVMSMNFSPSLNPQTFFTHKVVGARFTTANEKDGSEGPGSPDETALDAEIDGALTLNSDYLKWRRHGKVVLEWRFKTEEDRLNALERYFGMHINEQDRESIKGTAAAIGVTAMDHD